MKRRLFFILCAVVFFLLCCISFVAVSCVSSDTVIKVDRVDEAYILPALIGALGGIASTVFSGIGANNRNAQNIQFQQQENEITRQREDTAVQRRAYDLQAAGLSKTLAAGSAASANALQAPQNSFSPDYSGISSGASNAANSILSERQRKQAKDIAEAELKVKKEQLDMEWYKAMAQGQYWKDMASAEGTKAAASASQADTAAQKVANDYEIAKGNLAVYEQVGASEVERNMATANATSAGVEQRWEEIALKREEVGIMHSRLDNETRDSLSLERMRDADINLMKSSEMLNYVCSREKSKMLSANLAKAQAEIFNLATNGQLNIVKASLTEAEIYHEVSSFIKDLCEANNLNARTQEILTDTFIKEYNLGVAQSDHGKTTDSTVTDSQREKQKVDIAGSILNSILRMIGFGFVFGH